MKEEYYTDPDKFFKDIKDYSKEIIGMVSLCDKPPTHIGFLVCHEGEDPKDKTFFLDIKSLQNCHPLVKETLKTHQGKLNIAQSLSYVQIKNND